MLNQRRTQQIKSGQRPDSCVNRAMLEMVTRGTYQEKNIDSDEFTKNFDPRYILAYKQYQKEIGVTFFDVTTLKIYVGCFMEDD